MTKSSGAHSKPPHWRDNCTRSIFKPNHCSTCCIHRKKERERERERKSHVGLQGHTTPEFLSSTIHCTTKGTEIRLCSFAQLIRRIPADNYWCHTVISLHTGPGWHQPDNTCPQAWWLQNALAQTNSQPWQSDETPNLSFTIWQKCWGISVQ